MKFIFHLISIQFNTSTVQFNYIAFPRSIHKIWNEIWTKKILLQWTLGHGTVIGKVMNERWTLISLVYLDVLTDWLTDWKLEIMELFTNVQFSFTFSSFSWITFKYDEYSLLFNIYTNKMNQCEYDYYVVEIDQILKKNNIC